MVTIRRMILLIPLLGIVAGAFALFDAKTIGIGLLIIGAAALMIRALIRLSQAEPKEYEPARVKSAEAIGDGFGSILVEANHPSKVSALNLPHGSRTRTLERNQLYMVTFPISADRNPTSYTYEIARINGYKAGG